MAWQVATSSRKGRAAKVTPEAMLAAAVEVEPPRLASPHSWWQGSGESAHSGWIDYVGKHSYVVENAVERLEKGHQGGVRMLLATDFDSSWTWPPFFQPATLTPP